VRLLIVGAAGFVGRHLLAECRRRGDALFGTHLPGEELPRESDVGWFPVDLLAEGALEKAVAQARPEGIVHLAGQASVARANVDPVGTFRVNAEGTVRLLAVVRDHAPSVRVVIVTSAEVYGAVAPEELPVRESQPLCPRSAYGASKAAADLVAAQAARGWGLDVVRMRPFNHVGPGQKLGFVVPDFASQTAAIERGEGEPELSVGNLSARRDFTDVRDIARAYRMALEKGHAGAVYNLCSGKAVAIEEIVEFFLSRARRRIRLRRDEKRLRPVDVPEFRGDGTLAARELGWHPEIPLTDSLAEVLEEWRQRRVARAPHAD
jgi:GDP-4-dehydro-6-deoxy-D-mannose reductase